MKKIIFVLVFIAVAVFFASVNANAEVISFGDTNYYWPGWNNSSGDDSRDVIGVPNFTGGTATIVNEKLNNLTFNRAPGTKPYWWVLSPGDLFIDIGGDQAWDYAVDLSSWGSSGKSNSDAGPGIYNIYSISLALGDTSGGYILSGTDNTAGWSGGYRIRDSHPVAAAALGEYNSLAYFSGWGNGSTIQYIFDFNSLDLGSSEQFTIGWQPNCANDVIYENIHYNAVPEPATMSLLGLGVAGLLKLKRRKA